MSLPEPSAQLGAVEKESAKKAKEFHVVDQSRFQQIAAPFRLEEACSTPTASTTGSLAAEKLFPLGLNRDPESVFSRYVFRHESYGCVGFNSVVDPPAMGDPTYVWPRFLKKAHMGSNEHPFLVYVLRNPCYENKEFLSRLNVSRHTIPYEKVGDEKKAFRYRMEPSKAYAWTRLENAVLVTVNTIRHYFHHSYNRSFSLPRLPSTYGFDRTFDTLDDLQRHVMTSKDSFDVLFAFLSYCVTATALTPHANHDHHVRQRLSGRTSEAVDSISAYVPTWVQDAVHDGVIHPTWADMILFSEISNFTIPRAGVYIKPEECEFLHDIYEMILRQISVVIMWPLRDPLCAKDKLLAVPEPLRSRSQLTPDEWKRFIVDLNREPEKPSVFKPIHPNIVAAHMLEAERTKSSGHPYIPPDVILKSVRKDHEKDIPVLMPSDNESWDQTTGAEDGHTPWLAIECVWDLNRSYHQAPCPRYGQLENEHWSEYLKRREKRNEELEKIQCEERRRTRLTWVADAKAGKLMKKSTVYIWEKDFEDGVRYRLPLSKSEGELRFSTCKESTKIYDPFENCWDICSEFDFPVYGEDEEEDERSLTESEMLGNNNIPPDDIPSDNDIPVRDRPPLHRIADENEDSLKVALKFEDWTGFVLMTTNFPSDAPYSVLARAVATALPFLPFQMKMRKLYGFCPTSRPYDDIAKPSSNLLGEKVVEDARKTLGDGSTPLDFDLETMRHLCNFATALSDLDFTRGDLLGALWDIDRSHPEYLWKFKSTVTATPANLEFDGKTSTFYKLEVRGEQGFPVDIFAADPIIALACMRMNFASGSDVLRFLLTQGCSFYTSSSRLTSVRNSCDVPIVGWREVNYKPDLANYAVYELRVQALMEHRAAAALLKGGLYWRLAMYYSKDVVSIDKVLAYTSKAVAPLSANEEDILIGKYNIYTGTVIFLGHRFVAQLAVYRSG